MNKIIHLIILILLAGVIPGICAQDSNENKEPVEIEKHSQPDSENRYLFSDKVKNLLEHEPDWFEIFKKNALFLGIFVVVLGMILYWNRLLKKEVAERKAAEESLTKAVAQNRAILSAIPDIMLIQNRDSVFLECHSDLNSDFYVRPSEFIGKTPSQVLPEELANICSKSVNRVFQTQEIVISEYPLMFKDRIQYFEARMVPCTQESVLCIIRNITERRQADEEIRKAKIGAEIANRAKSAFLAGMSHELRTPLNGILGYAQILKGDPGMNKKQLDGLDVIEKSGNHLLSLLNDILDLAKIESDKIELLETDFSLSELIQGICNNIRIRAEKKGLVFVHENNEIPFYVHADERRLRQVLINLLGNAVKFTDKGTITFSAEAAARSPLEIKFTIEDTGTGIEPEDLQKIFDPFHQPGKLEYQAAGTGLGLYISKNLIELMGGKLEVSSNPGLGSKFSFKVNLPEAENGKKHNAPINKKIIGIKGKAPKILMVDDNRFNRLVFKALLGSYEFEIIEAENGRQGLKRALEFQPDVIITDIIMPDMDGIEFIREIRQSPQLKDIIVFAASASVFQENRKNCIDAGADDFLPKPIKAVHILEKFHQFLDLEWIYDSDSLTKTNTGKETKNLLTHDRLKKLPKELIYGLISASKITDPDAAEIIVEQVKEIDKPLANALDELVSEFRFDILLEILEHDEKI